MNKTNCHIWTIVCLLSMPALAQETGWTARVDLGGTIPENAELTRLGGPVSGQQFKLDPGVQFDLSFGYRLTPWLEVGPELGMTFNAVDAIGSFTHHDTTLFQIPLMANVTLEAPWPGRFRPFAGVGVGGVASLLTFGSHQYSYGYYYEPDGSGADFSLGVQAFAGVRYELAPNWSIGLAYRFLFTDRQEWDVEWWNGDSFKVGVDSIRLHAVCLVFAGTF